MVNLSVKTKSNDIPFMAEVRIGDIAVGMSGPPANMDAIIKYIDSMLTSTMSKIDNMGIMKVLKDRIAETTAKEKKKGDADGRLYG